MSPDELERFGEERRDEDGRDRDRIAILAKHFARIARDLDTHLDQATRHFIAVSRILLVAIALALAFLGYGAWQQHRQGVKLDEQAAALDKQADLLERQAKATAAVGVEQTRTRYRAVYTACRERDKTNDGIVAYLRRLGASSEDVRRARRYFPNEPDCRKYTATLLGQPAPKGAFNVPEVLKERIRRPG